MGIKDKFKQVYLDEIIFLVSSKDALLTFYYPRKFYLDNNNTIPNDEEYIRKHHPEWIQGE